MTSILRLSISIVTAAAVALTSVPRQILAAEPIGRAAYEACQARDDAGLRSAVTDIAQQAITNGTKSIDYNALVAQQWRDHDLDRVIDGRVDIAVADVINETSWTERLQSLADSEKSQKIATAVAERVYRSDTVTAAIEELATGVAKDVGKTIELASSDATGSLIECLKAFVGPRYGSAVAQALAGDANKGLAVDPNKGSSSVSAGSVLQQSSGGLAGATILIVRRQLANLATRVGQRIVGSVLSRLVSAVAGGVGLVLIAKDIWDFRNGVLPIIATEMKAPATKDKVREELAKTLADQMNDHVHEIAVAAADHLVDVWQSFKRAHDLVLRLADANGEFRKFLDGVQPESLPRLDEVVSIVVASEGQDAVLKHLNDGSLNAAVHQMPEKAMQIARDTKSIGDALAWTSLAGDKLDQVINYDLHRRIAPGDLTKASLDRILSLNDRPSIVRISSIPAAARDTLFNLDQNDLNILLKTLSEDELKSLAGYLDGLQQGPRDKILKAIAADPSKMRLLASNRVRKEIIASHDQGAATDMMLRETSGLSPNAFADDAKLVFDGRVDPLLLWEKHPQGVAVIGGVALILLLWLGRLFRPRSPRPTAPQTDA